MSYLLNWFYLKVTELDRSSTSSPITSIRIFPPWDIRSESQIHIAIESVLQKRFLIVVFCYYAESVKLQLTSINSTLVIETLPANASTASGDSAPCTALRIATLTPKQTPVMVMSAYHGCSALALPCYNRRAFVSACVRACAVLRRDRKEKAVTNGVEKTAWLPSELSRDVSKTSLDGWTSLAMYPNWLEVRWFDN